MGAAIHYHHIQLNYVRQYVAIREFNVYTDKNEQL